MNIEKYLVLNKYLLSLLDVNDFKDLQNELKDVSTEIDLDGRSHFINIIRSKFKTKISESVLLNYDVNIQEYVKKINYKREPVNLKYFQYLAILFTEIFFDNLKNNKTQFLYDLNEFLENYKRDNEINFINPFIESDLNKIAYWMATGSGKTLIMHINYYQFMKYKLFEPDNIILITTNEGLSKQHYEELLKSGIPATLYQGTLKSGFSNKNEVLVIEITKLVEEKKGGGVTLPLEVFEGKNLVFVDEGHKGQAGNKEEMKWKQRRDNISKDGFTFEYSATFGQILTIPSEKKIKDKSHFVFEEYVKSIIFDYSYKYFYLDGYGKDFTVLNVKDIKIDEKEFKNTIFLANLLSFYEQLLIYEDNLNLMKEYNLEKPLWIFVGTTVIKKEMKESEEILSDVVEILNFIKNVINDEKWVKNNIEKILKGNTQFKNKDNLDIFSNKFNYLKSRGLDFDDLYKRIFGGKGQLKVYEIKNAEGEFGLKIGENDYFGVINIGDASRFKKYLEQQDISVDQDVITSSLFDNIKMEKSKINVLIGSKKFIEGWDTWRVSSMGLLNIGKGQGPQIIQLFGRGVRLKGKNMSLKRSDDKFVKPLETLNIFGIKADYLNKFLDAISKEEVEFETIEIPVLPLHQNKWKELYTLSKKEDKIFIEDKIVKLEIDDKIFVNIDLSPKILVYNGLKKEENRLGINKTLLQNYIDLFNWQKIYKEILEYKLIRNYYNLIFDLGTLKNLLYSNQYKILVPFDIKINNYDDLTNLENIVLMVLKKYIDLFYRKYANIYETENLKITKLNEQKPLSIFEKSGENYYIIQINKEKEKLIEDIKNLIKDLDKLIKKEDDILPRLYFDKHLYIPILLNNKNIDKITPEGLVQSEEKFIKGLRDYFKDKKDYLIKYEIYVLRNFPKSGVGFQLQWSGFYPDFIMWLKDNYKQIIAFIDPKGLVHSKGLDDEKILFAGKYKISSDLLTIKDIEKQLGNNNIMLESIIISDTNYYDLIKGIPDPPKKEDYENCNVLFFEDNNWVEKLFKILIKS